MVLNVVMSALIWGTSAIVLLSILFTGGVPLPAKWKQKLAFMDKTEAYRVNFSPKRSSYAEIFCSAFVFRIAMIFFAAVAICLFAVDGDVVTELSLDDFLDKFVIWDANSYVNIAKGGYTQYLENGEPITLVFFPFYSCLIKMVSIVVRDVRMAGLLTSALCFSVGCCFLYAYTCKNYGKEIARKAVLYLSVSPFGFFFGTLMSESAFFMMICICLYLMNENKWWMYAVAGVLCALTRMQGVLIMIPAIIHWFEEYKPIYHIRKKDWRTFWQDVYKKLIFVPVPIVGTLIYLYINYRVAGDAFVFLDYQRRYWSHGYQYIGEALKLDFQNALTGGLTMQKVGMWIPQLFFFLLALGLSIYGVRKHENKLVAYLLAYTVVSYSLDWLISGPRYMLTAVPMWIMLGELGNRCRRLDRAITILSPILMGIYFVGYLFMKQIV